MSNVLNRYKILFLVQGFMPGDGGGKERLPARDMWLPDRSVQ